METVPSPCEVGSQLMNAVSFRQMLLVILPRARRKLRNVELHVSAGHVARTGTRGMHIGFSLENFGESNHWEVPDVCGRMI
jgi:hypothetical protein